MIRATLVYLLSLMFPLGIWLGLEGYEVAAFCCLMVGWTPLAIFLYFITYTLIMADKKMDE